MSKAFYIFVLSWLVMSGSARAADWTEQAGRWSPQSYWSDAAITQSYAFHSFSDDKIDGASSVAVDIDVAAGKPRNMVELRFEPTKPLDLSKIDAITLSAKSLTVGGLKLRDIYLCSPGFQKLATVIPTKPVILKPGEDWRQITFDLSEARILDKSLPTGKQGSYDRRDVATICINFLLPEGKVHGRLLLDGLKPIDLPPSPVVRKILPEGGIKVTTPHYNVLIGSSGYVQSIQVGKFDFLQAALPSGSSASTASAAFENNNPGERLLKLDDVRLEGRSRVLATGDKLSLRYVFREHDFDIEVRQTATSGGLNLNLVLADGVVASLDDRTDRGLYRNKLDEGRQISSRLMTNAGPVLFASQHVVGYSRVATTRLPGDHWAWQFLSWGSGSNKLTLRPVENPTAAEAIGVSIGSASDDFLLPTGQPVSFDLKARNFSAKVQRGTFSFQICDYLTREVIEERVTPFELNAGDTTSIPTQIKFDRPGVFRGRVKVSHDKAHERTVEWVFTHDFSNYDPPQRRPDDFDEFWQQTLKELANIPMAAELTPVPEQSDAHSEVFKVSLAGLNGRRFYGWYWKPRKPGRYPVRLELPSSGIYKRTAAQVPHGPNYCGMWIAIHGLPVELDYESRPDDPAAWNYWTYGIETPQTSMWRTIYASMVRSVDFLATRPEVDVKRIMSSGGSQGGGLSLVLAGLDKRISFAAPAHSGLCRLDWTVKFKPGFWPFDMSAKPAGQSEKRFLHTLSYFDAANFAPRIQCPVFAEVSLLDTVTASGNQIAALTGIQPGLLELICDPWHSHASSIRGSRLRAEAISRWLNREAPVQKPIKPALQTRE
ncbi:MAG: acetylxylan esterase [Gimesia sp.]|nr:acetylxylan esterase [Gimesia sp.]